MGLINKKGDIIRKPKTEEEEKALNPYVRLIIKIRHLLGPRKNRLYNYLKLRTYSSRTDNIINSLHRSSVNKQAIKKLEAILNDEIEELDDEND